MKKTIMAFVAITAVESIVSNSVDKTAPRAVKQYPSGTRLTLVLVSVAVLAMVRPFLENAILGDAKPSKFFGMDIL